MKTIILILGIITMSPLNQENTKVEVPMTRAVPGHNVTIKNYNSVNAPTSTYNASGIYTSSNKGVNVYGGAGSTNYGTQSMKVTSPMVSSPSVSMAPAKDRTCQYCNGTGYINDNGNGELANGTWYFQNDSRYGDGTSCTDKTGYHDDCDVESQGQIYHHFAKHTCPYCNGTGKNPGSARGWTSWTGWAWSHAFGDEDGNGHCDEHYWHAPIGNGVAIMIILALVYSLFCIVKREAKLDINED